MVLQVSIGPVTEAKLREAARLRGKALEDFVREVIEERLGTQSGGSAAAPLMRDRLDQWQRWVASMEQLAGNKLPLGYIADDSREATYSGRGE